MLTRTIHHPTGRTRARERGATLVEFSIAAGVFLIALFGLLEVARMLWTYNAIADGVRQGARFAAMNCPNSTMAVQNVVVYGTAAGDTTPIVYGLSTGQVTVTYNGLGVRQGSVTVGVNGFSFAFLVLPDVFGGSLTFPAYQITMKGESAGYIPGTAPCS